MKRVTQEIAAGTEGMERRMRYKVIRYRLGNCVNCGAPRGDSPFLRTCTDCGEEKKRKRRKKLGSRPWKLGEPGRPPLSIQKQEEQQ
jgi:hypothetical protein